MPTLLPPRKPDPHSARWDVALKFALVLSVLLLAALLQISQAIYLAAPSHAPSTMALMLEAQR